jgi:hypothetical protein
MSHPLRQRKQDDYKSCVIDTLNKN